MILIPDINKQGSDWCAYWEDFLTDQEINTLLNHSAWNELTEAEIGGSSDNQVINKDIRRTGVGWIYHEQQLSHIFEKLAMAISVVNEKYFGFDLSCIEEAIQLGLYTESNNGYYDWHTDSAPQDKFHPRKLSMVLMLSDPSDYEGGELQIKVSSKEQTLETKKGRAWFFPSYVLHRVAPVTKGIRKTAVIWVTGKPFK